MAFGWLRRGWLPALGWIVLIFVLSSMPQLSQSSVKLPRGADKVAHFIEYGVLGFLLFRGLRLGSYRAGWIVAAMAISTGMAVGALDECYQGYIPGRDMNVLDFTADCSGVLLGTIVGMLRYRSAKRGEAGS